jgi:D-sedoheptulose 7-phosphate isomerase
MSYTERVKRAISIIDTTEIGRVIEALHEVKKQGGIVFTMGNGGSGCTASHFTQDISKGKGYKSICLCDNTASVLAYGNVIAFESIFKEQCLLGLQIRMLSSAFSCSGRSMM